MRSSRNAGSRRSTILLTRTDAGDGVRKGHGIGKKRAGGSVADMTADPALDGRSRAVVLVEGLSDRLALEVLARRRGRDLAADGVAVIAMHGATNLGRYLGRYGPGGLNVTLAGLCDAAEEDYFRRGLRRAGIGAGAPGAAMEALGFFVCNLDLEDELIRALGTGAVERIIEARASSGRCGPCSASLPSGAGPHTTSSAAS
jgi:hypothetical protein